MVPSRSGFNNALARRQRDRAGAWGLVPLPVATEIGTSVVPAKDTSASPGAPGGKSRWTGNTQKMVRLKPRLVAELSADHISGGQFRQGSRLIRWRTDRPLAKLVASATHEACRVARIEIRYCCSAEVQSIRNR